MNAGPEYRATGKLGVPLAGLAGVLFCLAAPADVIVLRDGKELSGEVVSRTESAVIVRVEIPGGTMQRTLDPADVKEIRSDPVPSGIAWLEIPVLGEIGPDVTADGVGKALAEARRLKVRHVVLLIDSPGGQISEQMAICDVLMAAKDLRPVALVKHAYSAAAIIAMACPTIVMHPEGQIGGAVGLYAPDKANPLPRPVEEKLMSVIRARDRLVAERAGHEALFIDAMSDISAVISIQSENGQVRLSAGEVAGAKLLKGKGSILTMTAREALASGLSSATVGSLAEVGQLLGYPADQWHSAGGQGRAIMKAAGEEARVRQSQRAAQGALAAAGQRLTADEIAKRLVDLRAALQVIETAGQDAMTQLERDQQVVQYTAAAYSKELYRQKQAEVQARYDKTVAELKKKRQVVEKEIALLREMQ